MNAGVVPIFSLNTLGVAIRMGLTGRLRWMPESDWPADRAGIGNGDTTL